MRKLEYWAIALGVAFIAAWAGGPVIDTEACANTARYTRDLLMYEAGAISGSTSDDACLGMVNAN